MLALRIEFVTGRSVATEYNARERAEWPPHPARVFSALVSTWAASEERSEAEELALAWLEQAGPPAIAASGESRRTVVSHFVPDNPTSVFGSEVTADVGKAEALVREARSHVERAPSKQADKALRSAEQRLARAEAELHKELQPLANPTKEDLGRVRALVLPRAARQERFFPSVTPFDPIVYLIWKQAPPVSHRDALASLVSRVVRIGHSSSLVRCTLGVKAPTPNWIPDDERGTRTLRVVADGQLAQLQREYVRHLESEPRILPAKFQRYRSGDEAGVRKVARSNLSSDWIVFRRVGGPRLPATRTVEVARAMRGALMKHADQPVPEVLSGHHQNGEPTKRPHLAYVPVSAVGNPHADGAILGVALVLPRDLDTKEREAVLRTIGAWEDAAREDDDSEAPILHLRLGAAGVLEVERVVWGDAPLVGLRPSTWVGPCRHWLSVTPVALDRNPGDLRSSNAQKAETAFTEAEAIVARSCELIGLPRPARVEVLPSVPIVGAYRARSYPAFPPEAEKGRRVKVHAHLYFDEPVYGPILLGAGRYVGLGLFRPIGSEPDGS